MKNIAISIIVPVYKVPEKYLRRCISSIQNQILNNIEIILVDDGSPDECGKICDEYAKQDKRIIVIHQENKGLAGARNTGYEKATGDWITFVDGDDWIEKNMCSILYEKTKKDIDIICCGVIKDYTSKQYYYKYDQYEDGQIYEGEKIKYLQKKLLDYNGNNACAYAKLIRRNFLNEYKIEHNEKLRQGAEGLEFNLRMFEKAKKILFIKQYLYHYIYNDKSISASHDEKNHEYVINCFKKIKEMISQSENKDELMKMFYNRLLYVIVTTAISGYFNPSNEESYKVKKKKYKKYLKNDIIDETMKNASWKGIGIQRKIILICIKINCFRCIDILAKIRKRQKENK